MKKYYFSMVLLFTCSYVFAQKFSLHGTIVNQNNRVAIGNASIQVAGNPQSVMSDANGEFHVNWLKKGYLRLKITAEGFQSLEQDVFVNKAQTKIIFSLIPSEVSIEAVVVKDHRVSTRKAEESLNIEIVQADFLKKHLGGSLMQSLERLPGVKTVGIGSGQSKPLIRGLGFNRVVVVDKGIKHEGQQWGADHGLEIDQFAIGEVELIKGAASFAYGSDAIGGVINAKPAALPLPNTFAGSVDLIGKSNSNLYGSSTNLYARNQKLFFDARLTYLNFGDYKVPTDSVYVYDYAVALKNNHLRNTAGREFNFHLNTGYLGTQFRSIFYLSNTFNRGGFFANAHGLEPRQVDYGLHDASNRDIQMPRQEVNHFKIINKSEAKIKEHNISLELAYQQNFRQEYSHYVNHGYMPPVFPDHLGIPEDLERAFNKHVYTLRVNDKISILNHEILMGIDAEFQQNKINGFTFLVPSFNQLNSGVFVYDKLKVSDKVIIHGALRFDYGKLKLQRYADWFSSEIMTEQGAVSEKLERSKNIDRIFKSLVWSIGGNYNSGNFAAKLNIGKSFRMPIAKELGANGVNYHYFSYEKGNANLNPEQSFQGDLTLAWTANNWFIQLSPFYNYFPNYIYLNPTSKYDFFYGAGNQVFQYTQSRVERYGAEFNLKFNLQKGFSTELLGEFLHARQISGDKKGYTLPFTTPQSFLLNVSYAPQFKGALTGSYFSVDYRITRRQNNIVPPEKKTPGAQVMNVQTGTKIGFNGQPILLSLQIQNLFNTKYFNHTSFYRLIELPEMGRNVVLSLKIPFNIHNKNSQQP